MITLLLIVLIRTLMFKPKKQTEIQAEPVSFDKEKAVEDLQAMIRCKTISSTNKDEEDEKEFEKFYDVLRERFPLIHEKCEMEKIGTRGIVFKWKGESDLEPSVLMAHFDVVSVEESEWEKDPFSGDIENEILYGRGTLDTKGTLNGVMQAAEKYIAEGFIPKNDIYLAFCGDEEINGPHAGQVVQMFKSRNITPALVVDEGGAVVEKVFPGVTKKCALIGIAEKGSMNLEYSCEGISGHSSTPPPHTAVGVLSAACVKVENTPFKMKLVKPVREMFDNLARHSNFLYRMIFANLWLFAPVLNMICLKSGGEMNAMLRTTTAFTQMNGSKGMNVIPSEATMLSNNRIICGETTETVVERIKEIINDDRINLRVVTKMDPSEVSETDEKYDIVANTISEIWQDAVVSPYLMMAASDSRHYGEISKHVYRFSAMEMTSEERKMIHGKNEQITFKGIWQAVEFYTRLIRKL